MRTAWVIFPSVGIRAPLRLLLAKREAGDSDGNGRGTYTLRITGTSGSLVHQATATLTVR